MTDPLNGDQDLIAIYLDFLKAFDTISHTVRTFEEARSSWISWCGLSLDWVIFAWQKTVSPVGKTYSGVTVVRIGESQGFRSPFLQIYIADMHRALVDMKTIHFADDWSLYKSYNKTDISALLNFNSSSIWDWLIVNKLYLIVAKKNKCMIIINSSQPYECNLQYRNVHASKVDV